MRNFAEIRLDELLRIPLLRLYENSQLASTGTPPSAEKGLRGLYFGAWCYRRPTSGASPTTFHTVSLRSTLAIHAA